MGLREKWIDVIYRSATGGRTLRAFLTPVVGGFFFGVLVLLVLGALWFDRAVRFPKLVPAPLNVILSVPLISLGTFFALWSVFHFAKVKGTPVPVNPPPRLVATGPYAHVRNPMVSGLLVAVAGAGVLLRSLSIVFILTPFLVLVGVIELKMIEEPELEKRLGQEYIEYKKRVPMFIPRIHHD